MLIRRVLAGLRNLFRGGSAGADLDDELRAYLQAAIDERIAAGMSPADAAHAARVEMGSLAALKDRVHDVGWEATLESVWQDVRYAVRVLRKAPGFSAAAVLTLALGIGLNTLIFSVVDATLLRPLPFPDADRLVTVWKGAINDSSSRNVVSAPDYRDWKTESRSFTDMALFDSAGRGYALTGGGEPEQVSGVRVTAGFFSVLGVQPMLGRIFRPDEEQQGRDGVVILSYGLWIRRYAADRAIVGKTIQVDGAPRTVVGVMPRDFAFQFWSGPRQLWVPMGWTTSDAADRSANSFVCLARLASGVTIERARQEMDTIGRSLAATYPSVEAGQTVRLIPLSDVDIDAARVTLYALFAAVGLVLLIACANVANLMLARAASRGREMTIRRALGAGRARIVRQLLTESLLLGAVGGLLGLVLALAGTSGLLNLLPGYIVGLPGRAIGGALGLNLVVVAFTFAISLLSGGLFGLAPAIATFRTGLANAMNDAARGSTGGRGRLRYVLVASEVALTLVVLAGAAVMVVSIARLLNVDPGLDPRHVAVMDISLPQEALYYGPPTDVGFCSGLEDHVGALPGVRAVSAIAHLPLSNTGAGRAVTIEGRPDPGPGRGDGADYSVACPGILRTLGIRLAAGREFTRRDTTSSPGVALINETMATRFWPHEDAVGKRFKIGPFGSDSPWLTVVGVFADVHHWGLDSEIRPSFLRPYTQAGWPFMTIVAKTTPPPAALTSTIKGALQVVEPAHPVSDIRTMEDVVETSVSSRRFPMLLLSGFAVMAIVLAAVGIAGVVGYTVVQRTQEIGIRMALGAQAHDVLGLVLGQSIRWTFVGIGIGLAASVALLRFLTSLLYGVTPTDPRILAGVSVVLLAVACAASVLPARRASRVDPVSTLRGE